MALGCDRWPVSHLESMHNFPIMLGISKNNRLLLIHKSQKVTDVYCLLSQQSKKQILMEHWSLIHNQPLLKKILTKPPIICYKKRKSTTCLWEQNYNLKAIMWRDQKSHMMSLCRSVFTYILNTIKMKVYLVDLRPVADETIIQTSRNCYFKQGRWNAWQSLIIFRKQWFKTKLQEKIYHNYKTIQENLNRSLLNR